MSVLSVYRRKGGGYVLSHGPMRSGHPTAGGQSLVLIGVVESEHVGAQVARKLAEKSQAFVSAKSFDEALPLGKHA